MPMEEALAEIDLGDVKVGLILAEEEALKTYLAGVTIPTQRGRGGTVVNKPVPVRFRWASSETKIDFPYILIDLLDVSPDYERQSSVWDLGEDPSVFEGFLHDADQVGNPIVGRGRRIGQYSPSVSSDAMPEIGDPESEITYSTENYKPVKISFQVSVFSKNPLEDRYLMAKFMTDVFPPNPGWLSVPADKTWRRMERVGFTQADSQETTEKTSPIFRKMYTISVEAEIPYSSIVEIVRARMLHIDTYDIDSDTREAVDHPRGGDHETALSHADVELTV